MTHGPELPDVPEIGAEGLWEIPSETGSDLRFEGRFLGMSTSQRGFHSPHPGQWAPKRSLCGCGGRGCRVCRCSQCRWTELRLFSTERGYALSRAGMSDVPDETDRFSVLWLVSPESVLDELRTRLTGQEPVFNAPATRLLTHAAALDERIDRAYRAATV